LDNAKDRITTWYVNQDFPLEADGFPLFSCPQQWENVWMLASSKHATFSERCGFTTIPEERDSLENGPKQYVICNDLAKKSSEHSLKRPRMGKSPGSKTRDPKWQQDPKKLHFWANC
jgi:hypothetical protein